jgi:transposase, IS6 family
MSCRHAAISTKPRSKGLQNKLKRLRSARVICIEHAFVQDLHRGHYELGLDVDPRHRLPAAVTKLAHAI